MSLKITRVILSLREKACLLTLVSDSSIHYAHPLHHAALRRLDAVLEGPLGLGHVPRVALGRHGGRRGRHGRGQRQQHEDDSSCVAHFASAFRSSLLQTEKGSMLSIISPKLYLYVSVVVGARNIFYVCQEVLINIQGDPSGQGQPFFDTLV